MSRGLFDGRPVTGRGPKRRLLIGGDTCVLGPDFFSSLNSDIAEQGASRPPLQMDIHPSAARLNLWERAMDGFVLGLFLFAAFLGGFASGLAGFAMGFVVSGIWLHLITPIQTTALIAGYGLWTQGYGVWKLRRSLSLRKVAPFIIGGAVGVPIGTLLLTYADPAYLRLGV